MSGRKGTRALELWCKRLVKDCPGIQIDNMTTSWRNGLAFCALVHHFRPDLIDIKSLNPEDVYENNKLAFTMAEKHLGIPALLDPEDMLANEVPDRLSVLTYLSQFYQRLGHTVNTKASESDVSLSPLTPASSSAPHTSSAIKFGKVSLDKCVSCGLPVYLAQRLIVLQKLYHRRCFRCTKCSGHLDPNKMENQTDTDMICESCKNEKPSRLMNEDQMGMIAFSDEIDHQEEEPQEKPTICEYPKRRPLSILERINMFEKESVDSKMGSLSLNESSMKKEKNESLIMRCEITNSHKDTSDIIENKTKESNTKVENQIETGKCDSDLFPKESNFYKSDLIKTSFLQTQLADIIDTSSDACDSGVNQDVSSQLEVTSEVLANDSLNVLTNDSNITDDSRLANCTPTPNIDVTNCVTDQVENTNCITNKIENEQISLPINVPPRRKKQTDSSTKVVDKANSSIPNDKASPKVEKQSKDYPDHLNPFSDDEEDEPVKPEKKQESTNPFGSSDEEDEPQRVTSTQPSNQDHSPQKRVVPANPFWSDGEEPSDDEETQDVQMHKSSITTSTPNLRFSTPRRAKPKAPPPPRITLTQALQDAPATSMDDIASLSSMSSYNSTVYSERSIGKLTPRMKKKRVAPTPPDSISTVSECSRDVTISEGSRDVTVSECSRDVTVAASPARTSTPDKSLEHSSGNWRITKRPAPGLPLPERRQVKLQLSPGELQVQLDLLETQQLGLERQGVLIEQMIRDKCEGDEPVVVPQEEVEDLVIQLCELVNEKNDLFRKQTELMYIRRQQRLEQEQADIEHEIRVIQSRPAVNRIDADKAREEQLVSRLVEVVRLRDELVQQAESERRRERQEDLAIATSIASRRAQRNSASNSSSMKSDGQVTTVAPKKNKVKDKVKKQFKKAKHSLIPKRKEDQGESTKGEKSEKQKKAK